MEDVNDVNVLFLTKGMCSVGPSRISVLLPRLLSVKASRGLLVGLVRVRRALVPHCAEQQHRGDEPKQLQSITELLKVLANFL